MCDTYTGGNNQEGAGADGAVQGGGHRARARADQDRKHVGGHSGGARARAGGHSLQHDAAVLAGAGPGVRRGRRHPHQPVRAQRVLVLLCPARVCVASVPMCLFVFESLLCAHARA